jgi:PAS domain S-box-containing protein
MTQSRKSPKELIEELSRLQETSSDGRNRVSMLHEISVYQEELIVQNEELFHTQTALEESRDRFIELYDFAPNAYLTLDPNGVVQQCNLTAAAWVGKGKQALEGLPFLGLVAQQDRGAYLKFMLRCRAAQEFAETELSIQTADGVRVVQITCRPRHGRDGSCEFLTALVDVTERRLFEREREQIASERAALTNRLIAIQDDERLRIARNLHDDLGQQVTALRLKLEEVVSRVPNESSAATFEQIRQMLQQLDRRLHFVASELRPAALELGIVAALRQFVDDWSANAAVEAAFHSAGIPAGALSPHVETNLYRIAQEALNNVAKYAQAGQVNVLLERRTGAVVLMVEDDGRGFDLEAVRRRGQCLGLVGMRERAQIVGGRLEVETSPGKGTSIFVHVPYEPAARRSHS